MTWWCKEPGHQHPWYWPIWSRITQSSYVESRNAALAWKIMIWSEVFHSQLNFGGILFFSNLVPGHQIATNILHMHASRAVMACAKICSNHFIRIWMRTTSNWIFHWIWMAVEGWHRHSSWSIGTAFSQAIHIICSEKCKIFAVRSNLWQLPTF